MPTYRTTAYRYDNEVLILLATIALVCVVIAVTAAATFCLSGVFVVIMIGLAYFLNRSHHQELMQNAIPINHPQMRAVLPLVRECVAKLQPGRVEVFVARSNTLNAYTFGITDPKTVVLYSSLFRIMDDDEIRFVLGHELGHVALGHTWLNTLVGGVAGIPASFGAAVMLVVALRWWNRACEFSADRAGMLACGKPHKAMSALVKLEMGENIDSQAELERALRLIDAEDDNPLHFLGEALATHPMAIKRVNQIRRYAASAEYRRLQAGVNANVGAV